MTVALYVSGHGFGHAVRAGEVARALAARGVRCRIRSDAAPPAFGVLPGSVSLETAAVDVGVVQRDSLTQDEPATVERFLAFAATWPERARAEAGWLAAHGVEAVVADIAPLGVLAAAAARLPSLVVANFSWDFIYRAWSDAWPEAARAADAAAEAYARTSVCLVTPLSGGLQAFPRQQPIPLVVRRATRPRGEVRAELGLDPEGRGMRAILVSFGGLGPPVLTSPADLDPRRVRCFGLQPMPWPAPLYRRLEAGAYAHPDLVQAVDLVLGKPGYGTVAECALHGTPLLWLDRARFAETPLLVQGILDHVGGSQPLPAELAAGRLAPAIERALATPPRGRRLEGGGAEAAAGHVLAAVAGARGAVLA